MSCAVVLAVLVGAAPAPASLWVGSTHARLERTTRMVGGSAAADGQFWFRVDRRGNVRGHAVVSYRPAADLTRLNEGINLIRTVGSNVVGSFAPFGAIVQNDLATIFGVTATFDPLEQGRQGVIRGTMRHGELSLGWAGGPTPAIPVTFTLGKAGGKDIPISKTSFPAPDPWPGAARVRRGRAIGTLEATPPAGDVKEVRTAYWSAQRIAR